MAGKTKKLGLVLPGDNDNLTPAVFNENFQKLENYVTGSNQVCTAHNPTALLTGPAYKALDFHDIVASGYIFALSGGSVSVQQAGFVQVEIHVNVRDLQAGDSIIVEVVKNWGTCWTFDQVDSVENWVTLNLSSRLMPCAAGDVFGAKISNTDADRGTLKQEACYMTVRYYRDLNFA